MSFLPRLRERGGRNEDRGKRCCGPRYDFDPGHSKGDRHEPCWRPNFARFLTAD
jgi:hypothetical protein